MNAKHKFKKWRRRKNLCLVDYDEIENVYFEEERDPHVNVHKLEIQDNSYLHTCPRCTTISRISGEHPYCPDCNWDSLTDVLTEGLSWAA